MADIRRESVWLDFEIPRAPSPKKLRQSSNLHRTFPVRWSYLFLAVWLHLRTTFTPLGRRDAHFTCHIPRALEFAFTGVKLRAQSDGKYAAAQDEVERKQGHRRRRREFEKNRGVG